MSRASGKENGMQTFNMSLVDRIKRGLVSLDEAEWNSDNPAELKMNLQGILLSQGRGGILQQQH